VARLCKVCEVARSAYYDWLGRQQSGRGEALMEEAYLANRIFDVRRRSRGRYGAPRVNTTLRKQRFEVNEKRVPG
jgi:putative transposase